jgi:hypothetical protein
VAGEFSTTVSPPPANKVLVALVVYAASNGSVFVRPSFYSQLSMDEEVELSSPAAGEVLAYDGSVWVNRADRMPTGGTTGQVLAKTSASDYASGWSDSSLVGGAARPLLTGGAYLDGVNGLVLGGLTGNDASTPDSAALDITGELELVARMSTNFASGQALISKGSSAGSLTTNYAFYWNSTALRLQVSNGSASAGGQVGNSPMVGGTTYWVRCTLGDDVGGQRALNFFYAADQSIEPTVWTQLGTTQTLSLAGPLTTNSSPLQVGLLGTSSALVGTIGRAIVRDGIGGTVAFDADFSTQTADALAFTESSTNAATVTINTTRYTYGLPGMSGSGVGTGAQVGGVDVYAWFLVTQPIIVDLAQFEVTTGPSANANVYLGIYKADNNLQPDGAPLLATNAIPVATSATGVFRQQFAGITLTPGLYLVGINASHQMTYRRFFYSNTFVTTSMGSSTLATLAKTRTNGTFPSNTSWDGTGNGVGAMFTIPVLRWRPA